MPRLEWRPQARQDLLDLIDYIADRSLSAAEALHEEIEDKVGRLAEHPKLYRASELVEGCRELVVRSNYIVLYQVTPDAPELPPERVEILSLHHARENPGLGKKTS